MRKTSTFFVLVLAVAVLTVPFVASTHALPPVTVNEYTGKLGGAYYLIRIPSNWAGELLVFCRGYSHLEPTPAELASMANLWNSMVVVRGFALAMSTFGTGGTCIKEGMIRTHQLTEYVINNYGVYGHVYLFGASMGGNIALNLGAKYPDLYDCVLDMFGSKNSIAQYNDKLFYTNTPNDVVLAQEVLNRGGLVPPFPSATIADFRIFCQNAVSDTVLAYGGTPTEKPQAYERYSPIFSSTDIEIPTITIHGTKDAYVPYSQSVDFMNAVNDAGHSDMYRLYKVTNGQHGNSLTLAGMPLVIGYLINWVENGVAPPPSNP